MDWILVMMARKDLDIAERRGKSHSVERILASKNALVKMLLGQDSLDRLCCEWTHLDRGFRKVVS